MPLLDVLEPGPHHADQSEAIAQTPPTNKDVLTFYDPIFVLFSFSLLSRIFVEDMAGSCESGATEGAVIGETMLVDGINQ
jgi:hypothetical protein